MLEFFKSSNPIDKLVIGMIWGMITISFILGSALAFEAFKKALSEREGYDWRRRIEDAGYQVIQAV